MNPALPAIIGLSFYALAAGAVFVRLWHMKQTSKRLVVGLALAALILHAVTFKLLALNQGQLDLSFYDALSLFGLLVTLLMLLGLMFAPLGHLGIVLFPAAAATLFMQLLFGEHHQRLLDIDWQLYPHIIIAMVAYALLSMAAAQATLLALQERALRNKAVAGPLQALPPLPLMETLLFRLIAAGFGFLTLTLLSGVVFVEDMMAQHLAHHTVLSVLGWLVFGGLLLGRWRFGWRGRLAIRLTLAGMAVLLLSYFGSKLVLELILSKT